MPIFVNTKSDNLSKSNIIIPNGDNAYDSIYNIYLVGDGKTPYKPLRAQFLAKQSTGLSVSAPLLLNNSVLSIPVADTSTNGYLSSTDWNTFNNKQDVLTNGSGTTANATAVDLGGTMTSNVLIDGGGFDFDLNNINNITLTASNALILTSSANKVFVNGLGTAIGDFVTIGNSNELNKRTAAEVKTELGLDNAVLAGLITTSGLTMNTSRILGRISGGSGAVEELTGAQVKTALSLDLVENTALSTWAGSTSITTLGTIATGVWSGTAIALNKITALTASRAVVSDASGFLASSATTAVEIGYVNGVTSAIQTQLDAKTGSVATVSLTTQGAAISATTAYTNGGTDSTYMICWVATRTRAATTSSTMGAFQIRYTNATDNVVKTFPSAGVNNVNQNITNTTATTISGVWYIKAKASTNIQYIMGYTSSGATTMEYDLNISIVKV